MKRKKVAAKRTPPSKPSPQHLTDLQEFQKAYGAQWLAISQSIPFQEAMFLLNKRKLDLLTTLSDEQIEKNGREILADLRGHLQHENDLLTLHSKEETVSIDELEEYVSPEQQAELFQILEKFKQQNQKLRYAAT